MPSATASGADPSGSNARSREHNQGNQGRSYTVEQKAAVIRIRRCTPTAFYDILGLEEVRTTVTDAEIKKAYRKLSLLTHPDKNGHEHADEAFKMVSRAFGVLGDKEKRDKYDRFGTDPDSRFASAQAQNPFSGFARQPSGRGPGGGMGGGGGGMWEDEISPEEMFQRFFGGGGFGGQFGGFDTGPQFFFNLGGGPGIRVHQFGGGRPRRRPREAGEQQGGGSSPLQTLLSLLPILFLFVFPLLTSLFSGGSGSTPNMVFDHPAGVYTHQRSTPNINARYFVNPRDVKDYSAHKLGQLDSKAELQLIRTLQVECENEEVQKQRLKEAAYGWFQVDQAKMERAKKYPQPSCERLDKFGLRRRP